MSVPKLRFQHEDGTSYPEWKDFISLENCCEFISKGATPTTYGFKWEESGIPFFRNDAIKNNTFVYGDYSFISDQANALLNRSEIRSNDILIAITGDIGKVGIVPKDIVKGNINQHLARIRIVQNSIPYFVYQYLCTEKVQTNYQKIKTGLSMPQLSLDQIRKTMIPVVSIEEQRKIADFLAVVDEVIIQTEIELHNLKQQKRAAMQIVFSRDVRFKREDGTEYPDWQERPMDSVCLMIRNGYTYTADGDRTKKYKVARIETISLGQINMEKVGSVDEIDEQYKMQKGDILVSHINSIQYLGNSAIYLSDIPLYHGMNLLCIRCNDMIISPLYLIQYMRTSRYFRRISERAKRAVNQCSIPVNEFRQISILVPCLEEQHKIAEFLSAYDEAISYANQELEKWKELKKGLLQQMFI